MYQFFFFFLLPNAREQAIIICKLPLVLSFFKSAEIFQCYKKCNKIKKIKKRMLLYNLRAEYGEYFMVVLSKNEIGYL